MSHTLTLPHLRWRAPLGAIWGALVVASWVFFYVVMRSALAVYHWSLQQPTEFWLLMFAFWLGVAWDRFKVKRGWWKP